MGKKTHNEKQTKKDEHRTEEETNSQLSIQRCSTSDHKEVLFKTHQSDKKLNPWKNQERA